MPAAVSSGEVWERAETGVVHPLPRGLLREHRQHQPHQHQHTVEQHTSHAGLTLPGAPSYRATLLDEMSKITADHFARKAVVYVRRSFEYQVCHHTGSQEWQYGLEARAGALGWAAITFVDQDLGLSGDGIASCSEIVQQTRQAVFRPAAPAWNCRLQDCFNDACKRAFFEVSSVKLAGGALHAETTRDSLVMRYRTFGRRGSTESFQSGIGASRLFAVAVSRCCADDPSVVPFFRQGKEQTPQKVSQKYTEHEQAIRDTPSHHDKKAHQNPSQPFKPEAISWLVSAGTPTLSEFERSRVEREMCSGR